MDTKKIIEVFEARKNVTKKAMSDFSEICEWVDNIVDNINVRTKTEISFRGDSSSVTTSAYSSDDGDSSIELAVIEGECGLYLKSNYTGEMSIKGTGFFNYINLKDLQAAIEELFTKLEGFSTREESAQKIKNIVDMLK